MEEDVFEDQSQNLVTRARLGHPGDKLECVSSGCAAHRSRRIHRRQLTNKQRKTTNIQGTPNRDNKLGTRRAGDLCAQRERVQQRRGVRLRHFISSRCDSPLRFHKGSGARFCVLYRDRLFVVFLMPQALARVGAGGWSPPDGDTTTPATPTGRHCFDFLPRCGGDDPDHEWRKKKYCCGKPTPTWRPCVSACTLWTRLQRWAEAAADDQIRGSDDLRNVFKFFDDHNEPYQRISDREDFEHAVHGYERSSTDTNTAYLAKKR